MFLLKFSLIIFVTFSICAQETFKDSECINGNFSTTVTHKGAPFGLFDTVLKVEKKDCVVSVEHKEMKMMNKRWLIDVCREPVHIKYGTGAVDVLKKEEPCGKGKSDFCESMDELMKIVQDDGLIFASGEKEVIGTDHGMVYCAYLLLKGYLQREIIFSRYQEYTDILRDKKIAPTPTPESTGFEPKSGTF